MASRRFLGMGYGLLICSSGFLAAATVIDVTNLRANAKADLPIIVTTWPFVNATAAAWSTLTKSGMTGMDALVAGCTQVEEDQSVESVGYGGSPDEDGETTLDAMVMDGRTMDVGAVASLRMIKNAVAVARAVMDYTKQTLLVGDLATRFALEMGFPQEDLHTNKSIDMWKKWQMDNCQPNFWRNVMPDPAKTCGPYTPIHKSKIAESNKYSDRFSQSVSGNNHDTVGMVVIDSSGHVVGGTSTNGLTYKIPGRVGDSPVMGAGAYVEDEVGGAAATGDGDVMMRFLPSYHAVLLMGQGQTPEVAATSAIKRIGKYYPDYTGAVIAVDKLGRHGAACYGMASFTYNARSSSMKSVTLFTVPCLKNKQDKS